MRRLIPTGILLAVVAVVLVVVLTGGGTSYRLAAVFDDAKGMVPGQQVKIAGAVVGKVEAVRLTGQLRARIVMSIERRFAPFHADASCSILPQGLISENYVECDPGRAPATLTAGPGGIPTVPLARTTVPFSVQDVLNIFTLPTNDRLRVLISELGIATSGRGQDLNDLLLRADPALTQSRRVLAIVDAQRERLSGAVGETDTVLRQLAVRSRAVRSLVDQAATVAETTATNRGALASAVARLPALLQTARPALASLDTAMASSTPLLAELQSAAPELGELTRRLPAFTTPGTPAVRALGAVTARGVPVVRALTPLIVELLHDAAPLRTLATGLDRLLVSARGNGALEGTLRLVYTFATESALYDKESHIATFLVSLNPACIAGQLAGANVTGCTHTNDSPGQGQLPVNEPSCGAKSGAWLNVRCPIAVPGPLNRSGSAAASQLQQLIGKALSGHQTSTARARSLFDYLLR